MSEETQRGRRRFRVMRSNYDKPQRCPDWSGPALKLGDGDCPGGSRASLGDGMGKWDHWTMWRCPECGVHVLPFILRKLDPTYYIANLIWRVGMARRYGWRCLLRR